MSVCAVVGGQYGSEGKGLIAGHIASQYGCHVRVGAANAGHTVYVEGQNRANGQRSWEKHVMQQIPCAAYANPDALLVIGAGALINFDIFAAELAKWADWREVRGLEEAVVYLDPRAHVITDGQKDREQLTGLAERIGSTSTIAREGIGVAQADRVLRSEFCQLAEDVTWPDEVCVADTPELLEGEESILLEGTQGTGLSLTTGDFPYVTSRNTTAAGLCADAAVSPMRLDRVVLVCRTYPIRVAGPSGPFDIDSKEIEWGDIGVNEENERTTVTKKIRRVATFSVEQVRRAAVINGATEIAMTFGDYMSPRLAGATNAGELDADSAWDVLRLIDEVEAACEIPVTMLGTGPHSVIDLEVFK